MYSQNNEEDVILSLASHPGFFLDVGAYDGKAFSNTLALVERGWSGVLMEPSPAPFRRLTALHAGNPLLLLLNLAVGPTVGLVKFWPCDDGVSTTEEAWYQKWRDRVPYGEPIKVGQMTWSGALAWCPPQIDFLNIDVEGRSADLLLAYPFEDNCIPRLICVEHDFRESELKQRLEPLGYSVRLRNQENLLFAL